MSTATYSTEYLSEAPEDVRTPRTTQDQSWTFVTHSCADYGPIVELEEYRMGYGFRTARFVVSDIGVGGNGHVMMRGVRLTAKGTPDRRQISPIGGMTSVGIRGFRNQIKVVGFHVGTWGRA